MSSNDRLFSRSGMKYKGLHSTFRKRNLPAWMALFILFSCQPEPSSIAEIPIAVHEGFGGLSPGFGMLGGRAKADNPWHNTEMVVSGVPQNWLKPDTACLWLDPHQFAFQNFMQGNLDSGFFEEVKAAWNIELHSRPFSERAIKCYVHVVFGKDQEGQLRYMVDTNNDHDFSDELVHTALPVNASMSDSLALSYAHRVRYEAFRNGKVVELEVPLIIMESGDMLWSNFPRYALAEIEGLELKLVSEGFQSTCYSRTSLFAATANPDSDSEAIEQNEYVRLHDNVYQNLGVDINRQLLRLKKIPADSVVHSTQVGFAAKPFSEREFITQAEINLERYQGKFLYLDFWGSWCKPCVDELPKLKAVYEGLDKDKVEFLGVANDKPGALAKILEKEAIAWEQIICENEEGMLNDYNIHAYPTSFIIDPQGVIVAKDVKADRLRDTLDYFLRTPGLD